MAFLFQDQNQGIRNDEPRAMRLSRPFSFIRTLTVGFGVTPNLLTLLSRELPEKKALAGLGCFTLTAGGDFHPALRTSAARYEQPNRNYGESPGRQQAASAWKNCMFPMSAERASGQIGRKGAGEINDWGGRIRRTAAAFDAPDSPRANPIPVCSKS
jgi:hypothetical protein